ncbi:probable E3 ubiquitin-protein ligase makorin-1, partial [Contarinia nasturtii]|uniref:probable E3 ubiquitin-protein ligase makorin-1 n=1 Tax=Contarinia nasturtii TaxID=265458 RepID=UPI0012D4B1D4
MSAAPGSNYHFDYNRHIYSGNYDQNDVHTEFSEPTEQNWIPMPAVCRFFLNGNCRYGDFCRNSHNIQNEPVLSEPVGELPPQQNTATNTTTTINNNINSHNAPNDVIRNWIDAPEFIPRYISQNTNQVTQTTNEDEGASSQNTAISYAQIVSGNPYTEHAEQMQMYDTEASNLPPPENTLCPYIKSTITRSDGTISCKYGDRCPYQHGDLCEICGSYCLHPTDQNQRKTHEK